MCQEKHLLEKEQLALLKPGGMTSINSRCKYSNYNLPGKNPVVKTVVLAKKNVREQHSKREDFFFLKLLFKKN